ncbi:putative periplasmic membrane protein [Enhygromyxa salina]|uniref:Putative periplasmic membrane protein n=1 Tax=Enhygromyxa salina TaxID=215803 RepID=A0A0C2DCY4_9BACT|nr:YdeI/OmpD-associated family protein [Enhygromyxa salina]KIG19265.1 putative periplasmic membrane protein [Enhygromyxa salina]
MKQWLAWLGVNHKVSDGLWVKLAKKASGIASIDYVEAREGALIHGWIDGQKRSIDAQYYAIRFTPRRKRSKWSKINREIVEGLIEEGKLKPAGLAQVQAARADGRWDAAYAGAATIEVHPELQAALDRNAKAKRAFAKVSAANRYSILYNVNDAKKPETRARRISKYIAMLVDGEAG